METQEPDIAPEEITAPTLASKTPRKGKWRRRILRVLGTVIGIPLFIVLLLQFSMPQTFVASYALDWVSDALQFKTKARRVHLNLITSTLTLENVEILDRQGKTMIAVEQLVVDFDYNTVLKNGDIFLKDVLLKRGAVNLILDKKTGNLNINEFIERIDELTASKEPRKDKTPSIFTIDRAKLEDVFFTYNDNRKPYEKGEGMDYSHFGLDHLDAELDHFRIVADTVDIEIKGLKAQEHKTQLPIHNLTTHYLMTRKCMEFRDLSLEVGKSVLRNQLFMKFDSQADLSDFVEKVTLVAHFDSTRLDTRDLAVFAPALNKYKDVWHINGVLRGRVNNFVFNDLRLGWGKGSTWRGYASMKGLPTIDSTYMNLDFREAKLISRDLLQYVDQKDANEILERLGEVAIFKGLYKGYIHDFEAGGNFQTALGDFDTDMRLVLGDGKSAPYYKAKVSTPDLHVGKLLGIDDLQNVAIDGDVEGTGFTPETAKLTLDTRIKFADFNKYRYQDIEVKGEVSQQSFKGNCYSKDANFNFDLDGTIDFNPLSKKEDKPAGHFVLNADIRNIDLQALNFMPEKTTIQGILEMDLHGLHIDSLTGGAMLKKSVIFYKGKERRTDHIDLLAYKVGNGERQFILQSDYVNLDTEGKFNFSDLMQDLPTLAYEYWLSLENKKSSLDAYYKKKQKQKEKNYRLKYSINLLDINPIISLFDDKLYVSKNTHLQGEYIQQRTSRLDINTEKPIDSLFYGKNKLYGTSLDLSSSKLAYESEVLASIILESDKQHLSGFDLDSTRIEASWGREGIEFQSKTHQADSPNHAKLMGNIQLQDDTTLISFTNTDLQFYNQHWVFDKNNQININPIATVFENIVLRNQGGLSQISVKGMVSDSLSEPLNIDLKQIDIGTFAQVVKTDVNGSLSGKFTLANLTKKPDIKGDFVVENLMYREMLVGDVDGVVKWIDAEEKLDIDLTGFRKNRYILSLMGGYYPNRPNDALDLEVKFNRTDLEIFEPFADEFVSKVGGYLIGKVFIKGKLSEPMMQGRVKVDNGRFKFNMLNTHYDVEGDIIIRKNEIVSNNMALYDERTNPATVSFKLFHNNFSNFYLDTDMRFYHEFEVMNTQATPNCLYYGTAFAAGEAKIRGALDNLTMTVRAKSQKGTKIFLPLDGYQEVGAKDYIRFTSKDKKDSLKAPKINLGGMRLNFNLDVNPNAEFEIIIDSRTGDMITAKGKGNIEMNISREGDFSMRGKYIIQQGKYNFTFANFVNKGFNITPNSSIQFNGDVFDTQLDVRAVYDKHIPLRPILDLEKITDKDNPEYRRAYSIKATLDMKGGLFNPEIKLGLDLSDAKRTTNMNLQTALLNLERQIATDEQERNRQVFSLLILNQLSQPNAFTVTAAGAGSSISEMLSNQFSNWISQIDEDLELSFNVGDVTSAGSYQLRVSYSFLDGRLRITREGGFTNANSGNQNDLASAIGDITVEYLLTSSGKYRLKTYRRNNINATGVGSNINAGSNSVMGFTFMYTAGFNRLAEMFARGRKTDENSAGGLRLDSESDNVVSHLEENIEDKIPMEFVKKEEKAEIEEEKIFPFKHRQDTLREVHKFLPTEIPANNVIVDKNKNTTQPIPQTDYHQNPDNDRDNEPVPDQYKKNTQKNNTTTPTKTQEAHIIFHHGKPAGEMPLLHRYGKGKE